jgi:hypothetical protein
MTAEGGEVLVVNGHSFRCQEEREMEFRRYLRDRWSGLHVSEVLDVQDDPELAYERLAAIDSYRRLQI